MLETSAIPPAVEKLVFPPGKIGQPMTLADTKGVAWFFVVGANPQVCDGVTAIPAAVECVPGSPQ